MRYKVQRCLTGFLSVVMLFLGTVLNLAQASTFTRVDEGVLLDSSRNRYYFQSTMGGARAFIPPTYARASQTVFRKKFSVLICFTSE